ncbi:uncharacterized protein N7511_010515 [Penicillium nucicola]|uniref:uncharacterized protein n=1 Tax=Penicillium nucicola TaxID=1850975 RepID=UPI002545A91C|nr:uncharacterized protein N7511_010515 [Penicillium nucicola]KAJ5748819.1 hypothetical protein N7511_010515 [Penicillium nucicola]
MAEDQHLKNSHMAIVLGIGLGVVLLIVLSLILTIVINRRDRQSFLRSKKDPDERLRSLDAVAPICTLEKWWTTTKGNLGLSEAVDGQFVWYVALNPFLLSAWSKSIALMKFANCAVCMSSTESVWKNGF